MSAQLIKAFIIVFISHAVIFSVVMVGFPVPLPRYSAEVVYKGTGALEGEYVHSEHPVNLKELRIDKSEAPWVQLRNIRKPKPRGE